MGGIKIVNILKDDTFQDILELFRRSDASEVIFVLPKNGKVLRSEDHFAAFASEAQNGGKTISILAAAPTTAALARKYGFNVMSAGKGESTKVAKPAKASAGKKVKATLAVRPLPADDVIVDGNSDAYDEDVVVPGGEQDNIKKHEDVDEDELGDGMHEEDENGPVSETSEESLEEKDDTDESDKDDVKVSDDEDDIGELVAAPAITPVAKSAAQNDLDYIEEMWRRKAAQQPLPNAMPSSRPRTAKRSWSWPRSISKPVMLSVLALSISILGITVYMTTGSATAVITPVAQSLQTQVTVQTSDVFTAIDSNFNKLPGQLFQVTQTGSQEAAGTGKRDVASKARGAITLSNALSSSPQTLIATTRLESSDGKIFRTLQTITLPGSSVRDGKAVPGTVTVQVVADKPGEQYNIPAGTFTIPAFKERGEADRYAKITGSSAAGFSGGANGPSAVVTQADYDTAKDAAIKAATEKIKTAFAQQAANLMILEEITPTITKVESTANPDDAAASFTVTATATLRTVAFRKDDLYSLLVQAIMKKERLTVLPEKLELTYGDIAFKPEAGVLLFTVSAKGTGYEPIDEQAIASEIRGLNSARIQAYFAGKKEAVSSATISLSPFWVRTVPKDPSKVKLQVKYQ